MLTSRPGRWTRLATRLEGASRGALNLARDLGRHGRPVGQTVGGKLVGVHEGHLRAELVGQVEAERDGPLGRVAEVVRDQDAPYRRRIDHAPQALQPSGQRRPSCRRARVRCAYAPCAPTPSRAAARPGAALASRRSWGGGPIEYSTTHAFRSAAAHESLSRLGLRRGRDRSSRARVR